MSGLLGLIDVLVSTVDQAPVVLGQVTFSGYEVPSRISLGGAQAVAIHRLPGGSRIIDAMGADDNAIAWSGCFAGPNATARARLIDIMRQAGQPVPLSFGDYAFSVVVVHFEYDLQDRGALVSYRIKTEIVPDALLQSNGTTTALATLLSTDVGAAAATLSGFALTSSQNAVAGLQMAVASSGDLTSAANIAALRAALQVTARTIQENISSAGAILNPVAPAATSSSLNGVELGTLISAAGVLGYSVQSAGYVNRSSCWVNELAGQSQGAPLIYA